PGRAQSVRLADSHCAAGAVRYVGHVRRSVVDAGFRLLPRSIDIVFPNQPETLLVAWRYHRVAGGGTASPARSSFVSIGTASHLRPPRPDLRNTPSILTHSCCPLAAWPAGRLHAKLQQFLHEDD